MISRNDYDTFGEIVSSTGLTQNAVTYTGQRLDVESGLMALGNGERYYNPSYGRFIQQDSYAGMPDMPQSLNRFAYTYNNPNSYTDPSGNAPQDFNKADSWNTWNDLSNSDSYLAKAAGFTGLFFYEVGDTLTFGGVSRQDRTMTEYQRGEITGSEALWRTTGNIAVSAPLLVAGLLTGGASIYVQVGIGAVAAGVQRFGTDNYEMAFEGRDNFSSTQQYAMDIAFGGIFGAVGGIAGKYGGQAARYIGGKFSNAAKRGLEFGRKGLQSITKGAKKSSESVKEMAGKLGSLLDEFSPQLATPNGFPIKASQINDVASSKTTMLSKAIDEPDARLYRGRALSGVDEKYIGDSRLIVDMPFVGKGAKNTNSEGWLRDASYYWNKILERHPEAFSPYNRSVLAGEVENLTAPINDATFRNIFKQYDVRGLRGKTLIHHHIGGGGQAFGIPSPLHKGFGGIHNAEKQLGIWGGDGVISFVLHKIKNGK